MKLKTSKILTIKISFHAQTINLIFFDEKSKISYAETSWKPCVLSTYDEVAKPAAGCKLNLEFTGSISQRNKKAKQSEKKFKKRKEIFELEKIIGIFTFPRNF